MKIYKERRLYFFQCTQCHRKRAVSFKRKRAKEKMCRSCRSKPKVNPNQIALFNQEQPVLV